MYFYIHLGHRTITLQCYKIVGLDLIHSRINHSKQTVQDEKAYHSVPYLNYIHTTYVFMIWT